MPDRTGGHCPRVGRTPYSELVGDDFRIGPARGCDGSQREAVRARYRVGAARHPLRQWRGRRHWTSAGRQDPRGAAADRRGWTPTTSASTTSHKDRGARRSVGERQVKTLKLLLGDSGMAAALAGADAARYSTPDPGTLARRLKSSSGRRGAPQRSEGVPRADAYASRMQMDKKRSSAPRQPTATGHVVLHMRTNARRRRRVGAITLRGGVPTPVRAPDGEHRARPRDASYRRPPPAGSRERAAASLTYQPSPTR